jgi:hypothetical protein
MYWRDEKLQLAIDIRYFQISQARSEPGLPLEFSRTGKRKVPPHSVLELQTFSSAATDDTRHYPLLILCVIEATMYHGQKFGLSP